MRFLPPSPYVCYLSHLKVEEGAGPRSKRDSWLQGSLINHFDDDDDDGNNDNYHGVKKHVMLISPISMGMSSSSFNKSSEVP